jgi:hypothetical protein
VSITSPIPDAHGVAHTATGQCCFLCGRELHDPAVFWMGATAEVYLHADCVPDLAVRMFRDVHEIRNPEYYGRRGLR